MGSVNDDGNSDDVKDRRKERIGKMIELRVWNDKWDKYFGIVLVTILKMLIVQSFGEWGCCCCL